jgi:hypothetical protein
MPVVLKYYSHSQHDYTVCVKVCLIVHFYAAEITLECQCLNREMWVIVNFVCVCMLLMSKFLQIACRNLLINKYNTVLCSLLIFVSLQQKYRTGMLQY